MDGKGNYISFFVKGFVWETYFSNDIFPKKVKLKKNITFKAVNGKYCIKMCHISSCGNPSVEHVKIFWNFLHKNWTNDSMCWNNDYENTMIGPIAKIPSIVW